MRWMPRASRWPACPGCRYKGAGTESEEAGQADRAELVGGDEDLDLADEGDKHAGPWNRMCKLCVLYTIKLSKGVPDLHSRRMKLSSDLHLAEEDVSFNHLVKGPRQDQLGEGSPAQFRTVDT